MNACAMCERIFTDNGVVDRDGYLGKSADEGVEFGEAREVP